MDPKPKTLNPKAKMKHPGRLMLPGSFVQQDVALLSAPRQHCSLVGLLRLCGQLWFLHPRHSRHCQGELISATGVCSFVGQLCSLCSVHFRRVTWCQRMCSLHAEDCKALLRKLHSRAPVCCRIKSECRESALSSAHSYSGIARSLYDFHAAKSIELI